MLPFSWPTTQVSTHGLQERLSSETNPRATNPIMTKSAQQGVSLNNSNSILNSIVISLQQKQVQEM